MRALAGGPSQGQVRVEGAVTASVYLIMAALPEAVRGFGKAWRLLERSQKAGIDKRPGRRDRNFPTGEHERSRDLRDENAQIAGSRRFAGLFGAPVRTPCSARYREAFPR
jgi:hypothetical protein